MLFDHSFEVEIFLLLVLTVSVILYDKCHIKYFQCEFYEGVLTLMRGF